MGDYWTTPEIADEHAALRARLVEVEGALQRVVDDETHVLELHEDGWTLAHPLRCRPDLNGCATNVAMRAAASRWDGPPWPLGKYALAPDGEVIGEWDGDDPVLDLMALAARGVLADVRVPQDTEAQP